MSEPKFKEMTDSEVMVESVMILLATLSWQERETFMNKYKRKYCVHCGIDDPSCPCWNDE